MLSEPRTQMRGSSELLAAMFCGIALRLYEIGSRWRVVSFVAQSVHFADVDLMIVVCKCPISLSRVSQETGTEVVK